MAGYYIEAPFLLQPFPFLIINKILHPKNAKKSPHLLCLFSTHGVHLILLQIYPV